MKKLGKGLVLALILAVVVVIPVLAAPIYTADITVSENGTVSHNMVGLQTPLDVAGMVSTGDITASGLDTRVAVEDSAKPHMLTNDKLLLALPVPTTSIQSPRFTTGNPLLDNFNIISGYGGCVTVTDSDNLELTDNFTIEQSGWWDTSAGSDKNTVYKLDAFRTYVSGSGNITSQILGTSANVTATGVSSGEYTITTVLEVGDTDLCSGGTATASEEAGGDAAWKAFDNSDASHWRTASALPHWIKYDFGAANEKVIEKYTITAPFYYSDTQAPQTWTLDGSNDDSSWTNLDTQASETGWGTNEEREYTLSNSTAYRYYSVNVTAAQGSDDLRIAEIEMLGTELAIYVNTVEEDRALVDGVTVPNTSANWTFMQNNVMPYADNITIWVGGTKELWFQPTAIISGTTLPDRATSVANNGVIHWGSNPVGTTVSLGGLTLGAEMEGANVFSGYVEEGDWLFTLTYKNVYTPYYPNENPGEYFYLQLLDGETVKAQVSCPAWGYRPGSVYLSKSLADTLEWGEAYTIRLYGNFGSNPRTDYTLTALDWKGAELTFLDKWVITQANSIGEEEGTTLTTFVADLGEVLNAIGHTMFSIGIPELNVVRPDLFEMAVRQPGYEETDWTHVLPGETDWEERLGPYVSEVLTDMGVFIGVDGRGIGGFLTFLGFLGVITLLTLVGQPIVGLCLGYLVLLTGAWFGVIEYVLIGVVTFAAAAVFVYKVWLIR